MSSARGKGRRKFTVDALFQDTSPRGAGVRDLIDAKEIDIDRIIPDPDQPRQTFDDATLAELAASISREGILQPIAVRYDGDIDRYVILHGERRWRASRQVGLSAIPAIVRDVPEEQRLLHQLMENVVREDLNAVDRAAALRTLKRQMNDAPWERVAEAVGIRRSRLFQLLSTEKLAESVQDRIRSGDLSEKQTRSLQGLSPEAQEFLANMLLDGVHEKQMRAITRQLREDDAYLELDATELQEHIRSLRVETSGESAVSGEKRSPDSALVAALRDLTDQTTLPDDPDAALEALAGEGAAPMELSGESFEQLGVALGRMAIGQGSDSVSPRQLRALRRLIDLALQSHRHQ